uniref:Uncharacterized protein n=1 Tax=Nicotiana tabacum TaxID=4097 RepID=A0A1S3Y0J0_TOBAC|nr:PREDICTED: uncharacterized protein LOC107770812 [Nicotiana tabacum]
MMGTSFRPIQGGRICQCPPTALSKLDKLIRFGPLYCIGEDMKFKKLKEDAWQHVINNSGQISEKTIDTYQSTIKSFEPTIQDMYIFHDGGRLSSDEPEVNKNLECLVMDGCFFLIVVLNLLGATANGLHYLPGQFIWGSYLSQIETQSLKKLFLKSIIFPGNQLPFLVLDELLRQTFFREIITQKVKWYPPEDDVLLRVLYDLIVLPLQRNADYYGTWLCRFEACDSFKDPPNDILHELYLRLVGRRPTSDETEEEWDILLDMGDGNEEERERFPCAKDLSNSGIRGRRRVASTCDSFKDPSSDILHELYLRLVGRGPTIDETEEEWDILLDMGDGNEEEKERFSCAKDLNNSGIRFEGVQNIGIKDITLRRYFRCAVLRLPILALNQSNILMLESLKEYEKIQQLPERDVTAYLQLLCDMVQTYNDAAILVSQGIIRVSPHRVHQVPQLLKNLAHLNESETLLPLNSSSLQLVGFKVGQFLLWVKFWKNVCNVITSERLQPFASELILVREREKKRKWRDTGCDSFSSN